MELTWEQKQLKVLMDEFTDAINDTCKDIAYKHSSRGVLPEQKVCLMCYAATTAVQRAMRDTLLKMNVNPKLIAEIEGMTETVQ